MAGNVQRTAVGIRHSAETATKTGIACVMYPRHFKSSVRSVSGGQGLMTYSESVLQADSIREIATTSKWSTIMCVNKESHHTGDRSRYQLFTNRPALLHPPTHLRCISYLLITVSRPAHRHTFIYELRSSPATQTYAYYMAGDVRVPAPSASASGRRGSPPGSHSHLHSPPPLPQSPSSAPGQA